MSRGSSGSVFLSYASEDAQAAERIAEALRGEGIEVWFDRSDLRGGDAWDRRIRKQIHDCALFVPVISATTQARPEGYFRLEWKLAVERTHLMSERLAFLVPVVIDGSREQDADVPDAFKAMQWSRLPGGETPKAFVERISSLLSPERGQVSSQVGQVAGAAPDLRDRPAESSSFRPSRRAVASVVAVAVIAVGYLALDRFVLARRPAAAASTSAAPEKSIAVLPFVDMSEKQDQEYFSDGLSEELIDQLAHSEDLKVIARTSSFQFKGKSEDVRTIAARLGVANLLEGSVRTAGHDMRITAQLVRASDGVHLWSQTYERQMSDIFKVQDEIAGMVVQALDATLAGKASARSASTPNAEAHQLLLKGDFFYNRSSVGDHDRAIAQFRQALAIDPDYSLAWARLGRVYVFQGQIGEITGAEAQAKAREALGRALSLDPGSAVAHRWLGRLYAQFDYDMAAAKREFDKAIALDANGPEGQNARQDLVTETAFRTGRFAEIIELARQDLVTNPLDAASLWFLGAMQYLGGHVQESLATRLRVLELAPTYGGAQADVAFSWLQLGKVDEALAAAAQETDELSRLLALACAYHVAGRNSESDSAMAQLEARFANRAAVAIAQAHSCRGEADAALDWLEKGYQHRESNMITLKVEPSFAGLRGKPRFKELLRKVNLAD